MEDAFNKKAVSKAKYLSIVYNKLNVIYFTVFNYLAVHVIK